VDTFDWYRAFPNRQFPVVPRGAGPSFSQRAEAFVRARVSEYDVIEAHQGNLLAPKPAMGFRGLLVCRSVGLYAHYAAYAAKALTLSPPVSIRSSLGKIKRWWLNPPSEGGDELSFANADLANVPNPEEVDFLKKRFGPAYSCTMQPFGLGEDAFRAHERYRFARGLEKLSGPIIAFIGTWDARKGKDDWPHIVEQLRRKHPAVRFRFLGTHGSVDKIKAAFRPEDRSALEVVPQFDQSELPKLLAGCTLGLFPSWMDGFGFAVIEKLAAGLPVVAYASPGPTSILEKSRAGRIVPAGDRQALVQAALDWLNLDASGLAALQEEAGRLAASFRWRDIAQSTLEAYETRWQVLKDKAKPRPISISVAVVTRNRPFSLDRALASVRAQQKQPQEVLVSDDSDEIFAEETLRVATKWNCRYLRGPRQGMYANRNFAFRNSTGTHVRTMDDDHEWPPGHWEQCENALLSDPKSIWTTGEEGYINGKFIVATATAGQLHRSGLAGPITDLDSNWGIADGSTLYPSALFQSGWWMLERKGYGSSYLEFGALLAFRGWKSRCISGAIVKHHADDLIPKREMGLDFGISRAAAVFAYNGYFKRNVLWLIYGTFRLILQCDEPRQLLRKLPAQRREIRRRWGWPNLPDQCSYGQF
jgi:glycosyltransferase involved in cell wall biosynthesis